MTKVLRRDRGRCGDPVDCAFESATTAWWTRGVDIRDVLPGLAQITGITVQSSGTVVPRASPVTRPTCR
jgi:hypothetical protein